MLKFTPDHEWLRIDGDVAIVGITPHAQEQLGDLVFVELPPSGKSFAKGAPAAVVESVKAASEVYAPITGEIVEINQSIVDDPTPRQLRSDRRRLVFQDQDCRSVRDRLADGRESLQRADWILDMKPNRLMRTSANVPTVEPSFDPFSFVQRHIGPQAEDVTRMLEMVDAPSLDDLIDQTIPADIRQRSRSTSARALSEHEVLAKMRAVGARNQLDGFADRPRLLRDGSAAGHPAQYSGESRLVHGLYAVSTGDQPGSARGAAQFPDDGRRADRASTSPTPRCSMRRPPRPKPWRWRSGSRNPRRTTFFVDADCHPQTIAVMRTRAEPLGWQVIVGDPLHDLDARASVRRDLSNIRAHPGDIRDLREPIPPACGGCIWRLSRPIRWRWRC